MSNWSEIMCHLSSRGVECRKAVNFARSINLPLIQVQRYCSRGGRRWKGVRESKARPTVDAGLANHSDAETNQGHETFWRMTNHRICVMGKTHEVTYEISRSVIHLEPPQKGLFHISQVRFRILVLRPFLELRVSREWGQ